METAINIGYCCRYQQGKLTKPVVHYEDISDFSFFSPFLSVLLVVC